MVVALAAAVFVEDIENTEGSLDSCLECGLGFSCSVENRGLFASRETTLNDSYFLFNLFFADVVDRRYPGILNKDSSLGLSSK